MKVAYKFLRTGMKSNHVGIYEKKYPNDDRPKKAIEAAKEWLKNPSKKTADAAADAARAATCAAAYAAEREKIKRRTHRYILSLC